MSTIDYLQANPGAEVVAPAKKEHDFGEDYKLKLYEMYWSRIEHEHTLANSRVSNLLTSQSFLLASYVLSYTTDSSRSALRNSTLHDVQFVFPYLGFFAGVFTFVAVVAAFIAINNTRKDYEGLSKNSSTESTEMKRLYLRSSAKDGQRFVPVLHSSPLIHILGWSPGFLFPVTVSGIWLYLLITAHPSERTNLTILLHSIAVLAIASLLVPSYFLGKFAAGRYQLWRKQHDANFESRVRAAVEKRVQEILEGEVVKEQSEGEDK